jgi:hypothetical protein
MIFLISFYYYSESAQRGFFSRVSLAMGTIAYMIIEIMLIFNFKFTDDEGYSAFVCNVLRKMLGMPQSTNQELRYLT